MMNRKMTTLGMAVAAAALSLPLAQQAGAAPIFAKELPTTVLTSSKFLTPSVGFAPLTTNYSVGGVNFMYVAVTLGGSAKFANKNNVQLVCLVSAGGTRASAVAGNPQSAASGAVFFAVNTGLTIIGGGTSAFCRVTASSGYLMGGSNDNKTMSFESWRKVATTTAHTTSSNTFITFGKAASAAVISAYTGTPNDAVIDVATGSTKFKSTNYVGSNVSTAYLGTVYYQTPTYASYSPVNAVSALSTAGAVVTLAQLGGANGFTVNVSGTPIGGAALVWLDSSGAGMCNAKVKSATPAASSQAVSFTGITSVQLNAGMDVCVSYNGTTAISAGGLTAWITKSTETTAWQYDFSGNNQLHELRKNGASFKLYNMNMPESMGGSATEISNIRLYNTGATAGAVRATLYSSDGTSLGTVGGVVLDAATFTGKSAHVVKMADLLTALGITAYSGAQRPWVLLEGEVPSMDVQVVTRNKTTGVVVNMSPVSRNDNAN